MNQGHSADVIARGTDAPRTRTTQAIAHRSTGAVAGASAPIAAPIP